MYPTTRKKNLLHDAENTEPHYFILEVKDKKNPSGPTLHWVMVKREENYDTREGTAHNARLKLKYRVLGEHGPHERGSFFAGYRRNHDGTEVVSLSSTSIRDGGIFLDPSHLRSKRIGTYFMNEIVAWVKQWPNATVNPIKLINSDTTTQSNIRRNRYYERFGLVFHYHADKSMPTQSEPVLTKDLNQVESWKENIREHDWIEALDKLIATHNDLSLELQSTQKTIEALAQEHLEITSKPIRWALRYSFSLPKLGITICCLAIGLGVYLNYLR